MPPDTRVLFDLTPREFKDLQAVVHQDIIVLGNTLASLKTLESLSTTSSNTEGEAGRQVRTN